MNYRPGDIIEYNVGSEEFPEWVEGKVSARKELNGEITWIQFVVRNQIISLDKLAGAGAVWEAAKSFTRAKQAAPVVVKTICLKSFPHNCPRCGKAAYIGLNNNVDCSGKCGV